MARNGYLTKQLTAPADTPVSLAEAKAHCVVAHSDDDTLIGDLISAATKHVETVTGVSLVRQQWRLYLDGFSDEIYLPRGPVQSISQVQYVDNDGATQTLASSVYELDEAYPRLLLAYGQSWPDVRLKRNAVWIDYFAGYFDASTSPIQLADDVPQNLKRAILQLVADLYMNREARLDVELYSNPAFDMLIGPYRIFLQ